MACINMYNTDHHQSSMMSPRISFSNDFVIDSSGPSIKHERPRRDLDLSAPDFEFSASAGSNHSMIAADEVFFKGRLLPLKENCARMEKLTLRDELLAGEEKCGGGGRGGRGVHHLSRPSKVPIRWKELLGLRKAPPVPKKHDNKEEDTNAKSSQEGRSDGRTRHRDVEIGI